MKRTYKFVAPEVTKLQWMRMATLIDTEGCVKICATKAGKNGTISMSHRLYVDVTNTDPRIPLWCHSVFGGGLSITDAPQEHHRRIYRWIAWSKRTEFVLQGCMEYFLAKREQAEIGLAFRKTFTLKYCRAGLAESVVARREMYRENLKQLKTKDFTVSIENQQFVQ